MLCARGLNVWIFVLILVLGGKAALKKLKPRKMRLSLMDIDCNLECFAEELCDINTAERDAKNPMCSRPYPEDGEAFCTNFRCPYCHAWKFIHDEEAVEQAKIQTRWLVFWRFQESKEELAKMADVVCHAFVFKMNV